jgi:hypothetical protein
LAIDSKYAFSIYGIGLVYVAQNKIALAKEQKIKLDLVDPTRAAALQQRIAAIEPK